MTVRNSRSGAPRVLFVSYLFPPVGGVGVHRVTKFVKYLPQFGWNCSVLTVENPSTPLTDASLRRDIPESTTIRRAKTREPGYALKAAVGNAAQPPSGPVGRLKASLKGIARRLGNQVLQPDPQILWRGPALRTGMQLLREMPHDVIVATGPPFSSLLVGMTLAKRSGLPLVLDYRDEWGISNAYWENKQHNGLSNAIQRRMQHRAIRAATTLIATTPSSTQTLKHIATSIGSKAHAHCLLNGFDPDDFAVNESPAERADYGNGTSRCRIAFIGTLWNLNPIQPFVEGLLKFAARDPERAAKLELVFAGRRTAEQDAALDRLNSTPCAIVRLPFVDHDEAVRMMREADALLLLNADKPETNRIINAKTFEYMAARRPIFVVAPQGDLWDVVRDLPGTILCPPSESERIAEGLKTLVQRHEAGMTFPRNDWSIDRFERRHLAGELAEILTDTVRRSWPEKSLESREPGESIASSDKAAERELVEQGAAT
jgi:hypothetical protein